MENKETPNTDIPPFFGVNKFIPEFFAQLEISRNPALQVEVKPRTQHMYFTPMITEEIRNMITNQLNDSEFQKAADECQKQILAGSSVMHNGTVLIPFHLTNKTCMYFWGWYNAKDHVKRFSKLAKYEHGYMTHNPMYIRNQRNCRIYREVLRRMPAMRKLHKMFIKEVKALGSINAVVLKYDSGTLLDGILEPHVVEITKRFEKKHFSNNAGPTLKWSRAKDRREAKMPNEQEVFTFSFG